MRFIIFGLLFLSAIYFSESKSIADNAVSQRQLNFEKAKLAQQAVRYDDEAAAMKQVVESGAQLNDEERDLFFVAYKNITNARRSSWRVISSFERNAEGSQRKLMARQYREKVEKELNEISRDVISLLDKFLIPKANKTENKVLYLGMKGNHYRNLAEVAKGTQKTSVAKESQKAYQEAFDLSKSKLSPANSMRLGVVLNFSIFYYEILDSKDKASQLATQGLEEAKPDLDNLDKESYKESILIMQLIRDNLASWKSHM